MKEVNLNRDLIHLFSLNNAFAYKIPDPPKNNVLNASKRPFDGLARFPSPINDFYFESKLIKGEIKSFSTKRVQEHQSESLRKLKQNGGRAAIILGCWIPRQDYWFMVFDIEFILKFRGLSIKKKDIYSLCQNHYNISLRSKDTDLFKPEWLVEKMITSLPGDSDGSLY